MADSLGHRTVGEFYRLPELDQAEATARWVRERQKCPECGNPREMCSDPHRDWYGVRQVCFASMMRAGQERLYRELHGEARYHNGDMSQWSKDPIVHTPEGPRYFLFDLMDGIKVRVSAEDEDPGDNFTEDKHAQPAALRRAVEMTEEG